MPSYSTIIKTAAGAKEIVERNIHVFNVYDLSYLMYKTDDPKKAADLSSILAQDPVSYRYIKSIMHENKRKCYLAKLKLADRLGPNFLATTLCIGLSEAMHLCDSAKTELPKQKTGETNAL